MSLLKLPVELLEEIVLCAAAQGDSTAPASLSLTCRSLRSSILAAQTHLWRHLFLTLFDPPSRPFYPWETHYKRRISASLFFASRVAEPDRPASPEHVAEVLESVLDVLKTARPLDSRELEPDTPSGSTHPVFPPLSIILHSSPARVPISLNTSFVTHILQPGLPPLLSSRLNAYCIDNFTSKEIYDEPLARLVAAVGPMQAARAPPPRPFFGPHMPGIVVDAEGGESEALLRDPEPEGSGAGFPEGEPRVYRCSRKMVWEPEKADGVRRLARIRAYDMTYLHPTRLHAPFLPITPTTTQTSDSALLVPTRSVLSHTLDEIEDVSSDSDYSPHQSPVLDASSTSTYSSSHSPASDHSSSASFPSPEPELQQPPQNPGVPSFVPAPFANIYASEPPPSQLKFDWTWLSAARTVVQHNLRDLLATRHAHALRALVALEGLRVGAAPGFVVDEETNGMGKGKEREISPSLRRIVEDTSFIDRAPDADSNSFTNDNPALAEALSPGPIREDGTCYAFPELTEKDGGVVKSKGKERAGVVEERDTGKVMVDEGNGEEVVGEECEGWDWAGVAGQWRRCVCWLDYKDLVAHNTEPFANRFTDATLYEVMRIVPMTLRVAKYTRSAKARRPTIHIAGTVSGAQAAHTVWGKVEEVADGEVRWSLFTLREDGESAWQSDGVQLGGPGSAAGVLGMWTSAEHEHMDPIGPFWAWKVGAARVHPRPGGATASSEEPQSVQGKRPSSESSRREPER
ncbi:hypothetical protein PENSPDRAFT_693030 [Peniophora sp. CONT]|nr:hypothetical protein PENSPDRAFT_693030 [Peniophora sp. CONT]